MVHHAGYRRQCDSKLVFDLAVGRAVVDHADGLNDNITELKVLLRVPVFLDLEVVLAADRYPGEENAGMRRRQPA